MQQKKIMSSLSLLCKKKSLDQMNMFPDSVQTKHMLNVQHIRMFQGDTKPIAVSEYGLL